MPRLTVTQYYNDNVTQAPDGQEQFANISEVVPGVSVVHAGPRADARLDYTMQALYFSGKHDKDEVFHNAFAQANLVLFPQSLFLDTSVSYSEQIISPEGVIDLDNLSQSGSSSGIATYNISPYIRQRYSSLANAEYRMQQQKIDNRESASITQADSTSTTSSVDLTSGPAFDQMRWHMLLSRNKFTADNAEDSLLQIALLETSYRISPKFEFLVNFGYEDNDFQQINSGENPSGKFWSSGVGWNPGRRTSLRVTVGERFFGKTSSLSLNHRTRRSIWSMEYSEEITTTPQLQAVNTGSDVLIDDEGAPVIPQESINPFAIRTASVIIVERMSVGVNYQSAKTALSLSLYDESRDYLNIGQQEETLGGTVSGSWRFQPRTTLKITGTRYKLEYLTSSRVDYLGQGELAVERNIKRTMLGSVGIKILDRNSSENSTEYKRNLAFVSLKIEF